MKYKLKTVDLFCGIGGLTCGLIKEGLEVVAGIDNDESCKFAYEHNNDVEFIHKDIFDVSKEDIEGLFGNESNTVRVLVGCAPCQPFSKLNNKRDHSLGYEAVKRFATLIKKTLPDIVSMENVSGLAKLPAFSAFLRTLKRNGYKYSYEIVDASDYGVPQKRMRLVLLASRLGEIDLIPKTHEECKVTVRDAIGHLKPIQDGEICKSDELHRARKLSPLNLKRVKSTPHNGGSIKHWDKDLILACHRKESGKTYIHTVYGRMRWDEPAPTMTTHCVGLGNGRFGHPDQDRAISLREAALFQTFPESYEFTAPGESVYTGHIAKYIGNAVPVLLGEVIGQSIKEHERWTPLVGQ